MKRYTETLEQMLGIIIYGTAQVYDECLDEVWLEAARILTQIQHPKELFHNSDDSTTEVGK